MQNHLRLHLMSGFVIEGYMSSRSKEAVVLPTAPRAARDPGIVEENIPTSPPYVAYVSNLSYEVDSDELTEFFENLKVQILTDCY